MPTHDSLPTFDLPGDFHTLFDPPARSHFEAEGLLGWLPEQRWFASKARRLRAVHLADWGRLPDDWPLFLVLVEAVFTSGEPEHYFLPLSLVPTGRSGSSEAPDHALARLRLADESAWLVDALRDEEAPARMLAAVGDSEQRALAIGRVESTRTTAFDEICGPPGAPPSARVASSASSNSLVVLGERLVLKVFRRVERGLNPDLEIGKFLTERTDFKRLPRVAGAISYRHDSDAEETTLAILQQFIPNEGDGWSEALAELGPFFERALARTSAPELSSHVSYAELARRPVDSEVAGLIGAPMESAALLGRRTAEMHAALSGGGDDPDFAGEPMDGVHMQLIDYDVRVQASKAFAALESHRDLPSLAGTRSVDWLLSQGARRLDEIVEGRTETLPPATKMRIHGDFHLGQVLRVDGDYVIIDFEGEPAREIPFRRRKFSPLRDVAGMLRSYHYAAFTAALTRAGERGVDPAGLIAWAELWQRNVGASFLRSYLASAQGAEYVPSNDHDLESLLESFIVGKAYYELAYELNNRPEWARIPISGLVSLLGGPPEHTPLSGPETTPP